MDDIEAEPAESPDGRGSSALVTLRKEPSGAVDVRLAGEVDISNIDAVRKLIVPVAEAGVSHLVFDLSELRLIDSTGLSLLLWTAQRIEIVQIRNPSDIVRRVIEVTGLDDVLPMEQ